MYLNMWIGIIFACIFVVPTLIYFMSNSSNKGGEERTAQVTDQGKFGYPYCPVCNKELPERLGFWVSKKIITCTNCRTKVTVEAGNFKAKIRAWEPPEELQTPMLQEEVMFCIKCGQKLPKDSKFCNKCGAKLPDIES